MNRQDDRPCDVNDQDRTEDAPGDAPARERRQFLAGGLVAGAAAAGLVGCKKKPGPKPTSGKTPGGMTEAAVRPKPKPKPGMGSGKPPTTPGMGVAKPSAPAKGAAKKSRVVQVVNSGAYDAKGRPSSKPVKVMVDTAVMMLTGKKTPKAAWSSLFKPTEKVGLKPNCLGRQLCWPHPATVDAIIEGLLSAGVPHANMYMWDMWSFNASPLSRRYRNSPMHVKQIKAWGYDRKRFKIASGPDVRFTKPLMLVDAVVNIPVLKDHDLTGITCALKNMALGSVPKPSIYHANRQGERYCNPMVPEIYSLPPIKDKARLIVADAFNIIINGGPKGNARGLRKLHSVFAAQDPVAMDRVAWTLIDTHREQAKLPKVMDKPVSKHAPRGRPHYILTAEKMGLGTADPKRINHLVKTLG